MFNPYYSLAFNPFDKQQVKEDDAFISKDFTEMRSRLDYLKDTRGIGVFTSSPGKGKSFCLRCFAKSLNPSLYHMEYIPLSTITVAEFYKELCNILGVSDKGGKPRVLLAISSGEAAKKGFAFRRGCGILWNRTARRARKAPETGRGPGGKEASHDACRNLRINVKWTRN